MPDDGERDGGCGTMRIIELHDVKTLLGPCMISFSLPLLIPGVVLTVVGSYGNERTFPTFGGWHITGILILVIAVILLVCGIVFKCVFKPTISPDVEKCLSPTSSVCTGNSNLGYERDKGLETINGIYRGNNRANDTKKGLHRVVSTHDTTENSKGRRKPREPIDKPGGGSRMNTSRVKREEGVAPSIDDYNDNLTDRRQSRSHVHKSHKHKSSESNPNDERISQGRSRHKSKHEKPSEHSEHEEIMSVTEVNGSDNVTELHGDPPSYNDVVTTPVRRLRPKKRSTDETTSTNVHSENHRRSSRSKGQTGGVNNTVTGSIIAEAETEIQSTSGTHSRDTSSEANETSEFLPEKKTRKKRRRRRRSNPHSGSDVKDEPGDVQYARNDELPRSVSFQDGEPYEFRLDREQQTLREPEIAGQFPVPVASAASAEHARSSRRKRTSKQVAYEDDSESEHFSQNPWPLDNKQQNEVCELQSEHANAMNLSTPDVEQTMFETSTSGSADLHVRGHPAWSTPVDEIHDNSNESNSKLFPNDDIRQPTNDLLTLNIAPPVSTHAPSTIAGETSNTSDPTIETDA